jgi:acetate kinase
MHAIAAARPSLKQVACFDTAFHHTLPPVAARFALPRALSAAGVRRYGFHGLSYEYIASCLTQRSPALARGRVIAAHLGSGASLCALKDGVSIATTTAPPPGIPKDHERHFRCSKRPSMGRNSLVKLGTP